MPLFPLFIDLAGRKCVCLGGGNVAARKIEVLLEFNADITVISPKVDKRLDELSHSGSIYLIKREYSVEDLDGAFLAIAATQDRVVNRQIHDDAVNRNIFVNVADSPEECTFTFPSIVKRDDLVIGITTSGSYPSFSKSVREKIEQLYPSYYGNVLKLLKVLRRKALLEIPDSGKRKLMIDEMMNVVLQCVDDFTEEQLLFKINRIYEAYGYEKNH